MNSVKIRVASPEDAEALLNIYAPYIRKTAISFEYEVPSLSEFRERIERTLQKYPYLVAEVDGEILGYSYLSAFKGRAAYAWATETTIYVKETNKRMGIGGKLYRALENAAKCQNILNLNACIAYPDAADEFLTRDSVAFHQRCGYREVGEFRKCGYKFDRWYNIVWMEKLIGTHGSNPLPVLAFPTLDTETLQAIGITQ